ncbi:hypothetical protein [Paenibacillus sp. Soil750]|uniref:hypothetical protein n=1 Tax=Paenibacillus sp. Soil750 TaxID=1736398 RepID=UPI0006FCB729|nr:hypothetical protein [Paenibacillus sp. Soil750]KRE64164.1 hypothetical protein ASL11_23360 [Paenibacillus sp. Soil750]
MENISIEKLNELYVETIKKCGTYLISSDDSVIGYNIFEEFDIGATSFLHIDNLQRLVEAGLISDEIMRKSSTLRIKVLALQQSDEWNINAVRHSSQWMKILELSDEINSMIGI